MAPELALGKVRDVGPATDVYGLGAVLYEMLTGRPPFRAATAAETISQVIGDEPVPPSRLQRNVPRDLETVCLHCLRKAPAQRYASAADLADDLRRFLNSQPIRARPAGAVESTLKWVRRRPLTAALLAVICVAAVGLSGLSVQLWSSLRDREDALELAHTATARARQSEADARDSEDRARVRLYAADLRVVGQFWKNGDLPAMRGLLGRHAAAPDRRGFEWGYFQRLSHATEEHALTGHGGAAAAVAFAPDGRTVATGGQDGAVRFWDPATRWLRDTCRGHSRPVSAVVFLPDGRTLASTGTDGSICFWDPATGQKREPPFVPAGPADLLALSLDGRLVAAATDAQPGKTRLRVLKRGTGEPIFTAEAEFLVRTMCLSPDGATLVAGGDIGGVACWDTRSGQRIPTWIRFGAHQLAWNRNLVAAVYYQTLWVTDARKLAAGQANLMMHAELGGSRSRALAISPDGATVATAGDDPVVRLWDVRTRALRREFRGHSERVLSLAFSADGQKLLSGAADDTALLWDVHERQGAQALATPLRAAGSVAFSQDGRTLAVAGRDHQVALVDAAGGQLRAACRGHRAVVQALAFLPDGRLVTVAHDQTVRLWGADGQGRAVWETPHDPLAVAVAPDGRALAVGLANGVVQCRDVASGELRPELSDGPDPVNGVAFAPDGRTLFAGGPDGIVRSWDLASRKVRRLPGPCEGGIRGLAVSPDGRWLAAAPDRPGLVCLWDLAKEARLPGVTGGAGRFLAFARDSRTLTIGGAIDLYLADVASRSVGLVLHDGHRAEILGVAYHPGRNAMATTSADGRVRIWDQPFEGERRAP
jgi:WD40 repeat protein